ncbi:two-component system CheB/CheR fusion protein [Rhizobium leguminosarum]|uniref:Blue-light-activated histidine kinase n=1 Tax=Rhizobium leguminosarum TaxID=384 RepID=A0AAE2MG84_RHILE|nr:MULTISPECIES: chemotaxis protein CheB [Rhizobium]MBB4288721.1 two-component system CheB/CheR fusion protein [Rhizobium leguminosarum]MBB4295186.1 two-component system CheB/CheR fusion protein [Rhizobium leguminosarum]MBB4306579.1 two-component system CheB/CheR fusion protein [Rhizobium leguminosarum]MBB4417840.1 two-component system CheB/CheR fusion protein [Rhizobium leguminosarum]MBB4432685.1 two-component system CheB/CheR fusion protein [Rhizobium esperanzae]
MNVAAKPLIVGIGASAGGLEAFKAFFSHMPSDSGMAFVLVQHLAPDHRSMLSELLGKTTSMLVTEAVDGMTVIANQVFVIPPNATLTIESGVLRLEVPAPPREHRRPIDTFFSALADDQGENAVCIVLAGTGSDGALGLSAVKENGGLTMAQAEFDHSAKGGMPHSAVATGFVDEVLRAEEMPARLKSHFLHLQHVASQKHADGTRLDATEHLPTIAKLLRAKVGHDFSNYKERTFTRRIQRRMQVLQVDSVSVYTARLKDEPHELDLLFRELLIGVTQFFRDPQYFESLQNLAITKILDGKAANDTIRVWVPASASGEEAYSIAILLKEAIDRRGLPLKVQVFATDIDERAVTFGRAARYSNTTGLSLERLGRWFSEDGGEFCPIKEIRDMCIFSVQSVVKDPPFSKLDLVSCRNLLIYMDAALQDRVLKTFHYALKSGGLLFLGPSEGVTRQSNYFSSLDKKHRIFQRRDVNAVIPDLRRSGAAVVTNATLDDARVNYTGEDRIARKARHAMEKYSPAYLVVEGNGDIVQFSGGEAGRYLEPSSGTASLNLFVILRKSLRPIVRAALRTAIATKGPVIQDGIGLRIDGRNQTVTVIVEPIPATEPGICLVVFRDTGPSGHATTVPDESSDDDIRAVEHELRTVKTQLLSTIDELEAANEELKSATEEYQSVNEELQSSNEELETAKEEMQSVNEELQTINAEMAAKNEALARVNSDIKNLLDSTEIATLFLDNELRIKSFTPRMTGIFHLRDEDRGRPITDIVTLLDYHDLRRDVMEVVSERSILEREVHLTCESTTFILRIRPYRTVENTIDGVVLTFVDISGRKETERHTALIMNELDHRVKNILAVVSSVVRQTLKSSETPAAFAASVEGRITAIANAHSLLTVEGGRSEAFLRDLVRRELSPYDERGMNINVGGPEVTLTPRAGLTLALAIHELASNASKYGALSVDSGHLSATWSVDGNATHPKLIFVWAETGGPSVGLPTRSGFGTKLIDRTVSHDLDGEVKREFLPSGVHCTIEIPLTSEIGHLALNRDGQRVGK